MKMLFLVTDSEYEPHCMNMMRERGVTGYTMVQDVMGVGKTGAKMGDRVHPGASVLIISVVQDNSAPALLECIQTCVKEGRLCQSTHAWIVPVEAGAGF